MEAVAFRETMLSSGKKSGRLLAERDTNCGVQKRDGNQDREK